MVKKILEKVQKKNLVNKHSLEKHKLDEDFHSELNNFHEFWEEKIGKYKEECLQLETMLTGDNEKELEKYFQELQENLPARFKPSTKLLEMTSTLNQLLKNQDYKDAHYIQQKISQQEKVEEEKFLIDRQKKIENLINLMKQRQTQELSTLQKKINIGLQELEINQRKEYEKLLLKYNNIKKNIQNQQNMESYYFEKSVRSSNISKTLRNPLDSVYNALDNKSKVNEQDVSESSNAEVKQNE